LYFVCMNVDGDASALKGIINVWAEVVDTKQQVCEKKDNNAV